MNQTNWLKQTVSAPLFDNLLWSRPENRSLAGKVLVIGGNLHGFSKTVGSYQRLIKSGVGTVKVLLPKKVFKIIGQISEDVIFCPDTDSGSFGPESYGDMVEFSSLCDSIYFPGELTNNSQTLIVVEKFISSTTKSLIFSDDSIDLALNLSERTLARANTVFIGEFSRIQKLLIKMGTEKAITHDLGLTNLVEVLQDFSLKHELSIVTFHQQNIVIANKGIVCTTKLSSKNEDISDLGSECVCWVSQNPNNIFQSLCCSAVTYQKDN
jgi:NAD(P)H-hydrate repair Nnr-like enzyme with NAD(P)H-hydrate dehydratase domain